MPQKNYWVLLVIVMSDWKDYKLSDFMDFNPATQLKKGAEAIKVGMENLTPNGKKIKEWQNAQFTGGTKFINGDTLVARITPCLENGKIGYVDMLDDGEAAFGSTEFIVLRQKSGISDSQFIFYLAYWSEFRDLAIQLMTGTSGRQRVEMDVLKQKIFPLPPLETQRAIAEILSSLDDKIDLLTRQNATLEALAQTYFRQWFVEGNCEFGRLDSIAKITMGQSPSGTSYNDNGIGTVFFQGRGEFGWRYPTIRLFTTEPQRMAKCGDILISVRAPVGDLNIAESDCCIGRGLAAINSKYQTFVLYALKEQAEQLEIFNGEGTVFGSITKDGLNGLQIHLPPKLKIQEFNDRFSVLDVKILSNTQQIQTLQNLRDTFLPKLISGESKIKEVNYEIF